MQSSAPDDGRKHRPKHVELTWNNKLIYIVHLVGYFHSCVTMHGFMNVKFWNCCRQQLGWTLPDTVNRVKCSWWWAKHRPKHVELTWNNKLIYIVHHVGYFHSCITIHGFINVKPKSYWYAMRLKQMYTTECVPKPLKWMTYSVKVSGISN